MTKEPRPRASMAALIATVVATCSLTAYIAVNWGTDGGLILRHRLGAYLPFLTPASADECFIEMRPRAGGRSSWIRCQDAGPATDTAEGGTFGEGENPVTNPGTAIGSGNGGTAAGTGNGGSEIGTGAGNPGTDGSDAGATNPPDPGATNPADPGGSNVD